MEVCFGPVYGRAEGSTPTGPVFLCFFERISARYPTGCFLVLHSNGHLCRRAEPRGIDDSALTQEVYILVPRPTDTSLRRYVGGLVPTRTYLLAAQVD